ncbi:uncharacterized protein LOC128555199 [Mercenaria mercenaria]|uniref:uncharacterized protein LOC128555199 n=1 Tax=Mercenaria mercenaria TaxID=6596 RepID=UPI00234F8F50|nr:uncharacterized protein LOC128555199 [Mercenaria mercenaria]
MSVNSHLQMQMLQNQKIMLEQQSTVAGLVKKFDALAKQMDKRRRSDLLKLPRQPKPPTITGSGYEDVSDSDSSYPSDNDASLLDSDDDGSVEGHQVGNNDCSSESLRLLAEMSRDFKKPEETGPKVDRVLADTVNFGISQPVDRKIATKLCDNQKRPSNCEFLRVPKVNKELWVSSSLSKNIKERDRKMQTIQQYMTAGLIPLVNLMDKLLERNDSDSLELARDSFQLMAYAHRDMTNLRRQQIKPGINEKYHQLCNDSKEVTENLLGDGLDKQLKSLDDMRKLGRDMTKPQFKQSRKRDHQGQFKSKNDVIRRRDKRDQQTQRYSQDPKSFLSKGYRQKPVHQNKFKKPRRKITTTTNRIKSFCWGKYFKK